MRVRVRVECPRRAVSASAASSSAAPPAILPAAAARLRVFPQPAVPAHAIPPLVPVPAAPAVSPSLTSEALVLPQPPPPRFLRRSLFPPPPPARFALANPAPPVWHPAAKRTGVVAIKRGMSAIWDAWGQLTPVTILQIVENQVIRTRLHRGCGEYVVEVGAVNHHSVHRVRRPQLYHFRRVNVTPKRKLTEFRVSPDAVLHTGVSLTAMHFVAGQYVDCQAKTTGKGFQGPMKRWGFKGLPATHGVSLTHRSHGSTGNRNEPGRTFKGKKMAGRMGGKTRTVQNLRVMKIDTVHNLLYVKGAVPGPEHQYVRVTDALRKGWFGETFPEGATVPFPTYLGSMSGVERELLAPPPKAGERDPLARARREIEK